MVAVLAISGGSAVAQTERGVESARLLRSSRLPSGWTALPDRELSDLLESLRRELDTAYAGMCRALSCPAVSA